MNTASCSNSNVEQKTDANEAMPVPGEDTKIEISHENEEVWKKEYKEKMGKRLTRLDDYYGLFP